MKGLAGEISSNSKNDICLFVETTFMMHSCCLSKNMATSRAKESNIFAANVASEKWFITYSLYYNLFQHSVSISAFYWHHQTCCTLQLFNFKSDTFKYDEEAHLVYTPSQNKEYTEIFSFCPNEIIGNKSL